jgi:hypothetical protein
MQEMVVTWAFTWTTAIAGLLILCNDGVHGLMQILTWSTEDITVLHDIQSNLSQKIKKIIRGFMRISQTKQKVSSYRWHEHSPGRLLNWTTAIVGLLILCNDGVHGLSQILIWSTEDITVLHDIQSNLSQKIK